MSDLRISIIGYGKMGSLIEHTAVQEGIDIVSRIDPNCPRESPKIYSTISEESVGRADVCIDFTTSDSVLENIRILFDCIH